MPMVNGRIDILRPDIVHSQSGGPCAVTYTTKLCAFLYALIVRTDGTQLKMSCPLGNLDLLDH
jgi:hypothetical protein